MSGERRSIYRARAYENHLRERQAPTLAHIAAPRSLTLLWILTAILLAGLAAIGLVRVPVFATVPAFVSSGGEAGVGPLLVLLLPAGEGQTPAPGAEIFIRWPDGRRVPSRIVRIEPEPASPEHLRERFAAALPPATPLSGPTLVAWAGLQPPPAGDAPRTLRGAALHADLRVGTRRVLSLLPGVRRLTD